MTHFNKRNIAIIIVFILAILSIVYCRKTHSTPVYVPAIGNSNTVPSSIIPSYTIASSSQDNKISTTISEKINNQELPVVKITSSVIPDKIETIPREYILTVNQDNDKTVTPILTIKQDNKEVKIIGNPYILKEDNDFIFKPFLIGGISLNNNIKYDYHIGIGTNILKYNKWYFLSPSLSYSYNKRVNINIEPVKYNIYSNTSIGLFIGVNSKKEHNIGGGISISI